MPVAGPDIGDDPLSVREVVKTPAMPTYDFLLALHQRVVPEPTDLASMPFVAFCVTLIVVAIVASPMVSNMMTPALIGFPLALVAMIAIAPSWKNHVILKKQRETLPVTSIPPHIYEAIKGYSGVIEPGTIGNDARLTASFVSALFRSTGVPSVFDQAKAARRLANFNYQTNSARIKELHRLDPTPLEYRQSFTVKYEGVFADIDKKLLADIVTVARDCTSTNPRIVNPSTSPA